MNWPYTYMCPLSPESPDHPPISLPTPAPLGCHRAPTLGPLHHTNSHRLSDFYMVMYMFQCYSLKSSHPHLLPLSPKVCSLHLCLLCRPACGIVVTIFLVVQLLSHIRLFVMPWTVACQTFLSFAMSWSLLKLMSIESVMPSNHLVHCHPLLLLPSIFPSFRNFLLSQFFESGDQSIGASASALVLPMNIQD